MESKTSRFISCNVNEKRMKKHTTSISEETRENNKFSKEK